MLRNTQSRLERLAPIIPDIDSLLRAATLTGKNGVSGTGISTGYRGIDAVLTNTPVGLSVSGVVGATEWLKKQV